MFDGFSTQGITMSHIGTGIASPQISSPVNAQSRSPEQKKGNVLKVKFTEEEDQKLTRIVMQVGAKDWIKVSQLMETRNPRQCRERWNNYINPCLRTDPWTPEEDILLNQKFLEYGPKWNKISKFFKNRSDNNIRNRWMMIARHRSKQQKSPISPAPAQQAAQPQMAMPRMPKIQNVCPQMQFATVKAHVLPQMQPSVQMQQTCVMPVLKEASVPELKETENPFDSFSCMSLQFQASEPVMAECEYDMWNDFSFY